MKSIKLALSAMLFLFGTSVAWADVYLGSGPSQVVADPLVGAYAAPGSPAALWLQTSAASQGRPTFMTNAPQLQQTQIPPPPIQYGQQFQQGVQFGGQQNGGYQAFVHNCQARGGYVNGNACTVPNGGQQGQVNGGDVGYQNFVRGCQAQGGYVNGNRCDVPPQGQNFGGQQFGQQIVQQGYAGQQFARPVRYDNRSTEDLFVDGATGAIVGGLVGAGIGGAIKGTRGAQKGLQAGAALGLLYGVSNH